MIPCNRIDRAGNRILAYSVMAQDDTQQPFD